jgi:spore germination cell wall hydrolase CwlJ-like protein
MLNFLLLPVLLWPFFAQAPKQADQNLLCLAANVYLEAGNQSWKGKIAVKDVTLNRGGNVCKTVFARKQFSWTHQKKWSKIESFLLDRPTLSVLERKAWEESKKAAQSSEVVLSKEYKYFHAVNVKPYWTGAGIVIGDHKFIKGS